MRHDGRESAMIADYQRTVDEVLAALGGDSTRGLNDERGAGEAGAARSE